MVNAEILNLYGSVVNAFALSLTWTTSSYPPDTVNQSYEITLTNQTTMQTTTVTIPNGNILSFFFDDKNVIFPNTTYTIFIVSFNSTSEASAPSNTLILSTGDCYAGIPGGNGGVRPFSMEEGTTTTTSQVEYSDLQGSYSIVLVTSSMETASAPFSMTPTTLNHASLYTANMTIPSLPFYQLYRLDTNRIMSPICAPYNQYGFSTIRKFK